MTDEELKTCVASLGDAQRETDRQFRELGRQIGGLSNKFGSFTEGLAYRSCKRILREHFGVEETAHEVEIERADGRNGEYDMLGIANGSRNELVVVEIKSHLRERDIEQMLEKLRRLPEILPRYRGMRIRGLMAAVYLPKGIQEKVAASGLYLATGADENFIFMEPPAGFSPASAGSSSPVPTVPNAS